MFISTNNGVILKELCLEALKMKLVIIDYGSGNLRSVENAFKNSIVDNKINCSIEVTNNLKSIMKSDFIVLPGVGSYPDCKDGLKKKQGLIEVLSDQVINKGRLFLGFCVGMQLMVENSYEKVKCCCQIRG